MNANKILKANNMKELKSLGSYIEVKRNFEKELGNKLGVNGWNSFFEKVNALKEVICLNKDYLASICDENSFKESKNKITNLLNVKIKARGWSQLKKKVEIFITLFCPNTFDPYDYYEKTKLENFKNSSKLEGIQIPDETASLESLLAKYQR